MSTRSRIGIENPDGTIRSIYCHWNGYLAGVGTILLEDYQSREKINELLDLGDISSLGWEYDSEFAKKAWEYDKMTAEEKEKRALMTLPYKDRGEDAPARIDKNEEEFIGKAGKCCEEYIYLWKKGWDGIEMWHCMKVPCFCLLTKEEIEND